MTARCHTSSCDWVSPSSMLKVSLGSFDRAVPWEAFCFCELPGAPAGSSQLHLAHRREKVRALSQQARVPDVRAASMASTAPVDLRDCI